MGGGCGGGQREEVRHFSAKAASASISVEKGAAALH